MAEKIKNIFISHVHEDDEELGKLKDLLAKSPYQFRDSSIDSSNPNNAKDPDYIKTEILAPRIRWAGTVLVLISADTHKSTYVDWEIEYAHKQNKNIVGVFCQGAKDSDVPKNLLKYGDSQKVGWNLQAIIEAIEGNFEPWSTANGDPVEPRQIPRFKC